MQIRGRIAVISLGAVALAGGIGIGVSYADDPTPSPSPSAGSPSSADPGTQAHPKGHTEHARRALIRHALHGELTVGGEKQTRVVDFQRGTVDKVSATSITVKSTDGFTKTYVVNHDTVTRKDGDSAKITDIGAGDTVRVVALQDGSTGTARVIAERRDR